MKYAALGQHLKDIPASKSEATLRFEDIEKIIGEKLPKSASTYREWWANQDGGSRAPHWRAAGFEVDNVDFGRKLGRFRRANAGTAKQAKVKNATTGRRPDAPHEKVLLNAGFRKVGHWSQKDGALVLNGEIPKETATYAVAVDGLVHYIGSASMGLKKRVYFYGRPGKTQRTSLRVNALIREQIDAGKTVELLAAFPEPSSWNGLPVDVVTGLETGLVKKFCPPWNKRGVNSEALAQAMATGDVTQE